METAARRRAFRSFASKELNKPSNIGRVTKILKKMEGATQSACPGQAIGGDRGRLAVEDRQKASAFVKTYASVSRQVRARHQDRTTKAGLQSFKNVPCRCGGARSDACQAFSTQELDTQIQNLKMRKAPGPDGVCGEHIRHLGPIAKAALLDLINRSWLRSEVPSSWKRARIIPIIKTGKDPQKTSSYRPISLTSHIAKLAERMVGARLNHIAERDELVPPEQVGFRRGRTAEEHVGRLVQHVQDGWNRPKPRGRPVEGRTAEKFVLLSFDFARAYDTIDHRMLKLKLLRLSLPRCLVNWIFQFLRDRRARVEVNGVPSEERPFRAGLPQGSVLAPSLFTLWSADLAAALRGIPGTTVLMYADDTATLSSGSTLPIARSRAQLAADTLAKWAITWKANIAGEKTQALVLSQWAQDAKDFHIKVAGATVEGSPHLKILGVTLDRLLHFGQHCSSIRKKVKPRTAHLRRMTGRSWGLGEAQLRTVANGYVRGALEYCAAAWMPAASPSHIEVIERELRAVARVVTGCPSSTPTDALMAEAGMLPAGVRRGALATRMLGLASSLPPGDPLRAVSEARAPVRLTSVTGWRGVGREALAATELGEVPFEPRLRTTLPPWGAADRITFRLDVGGHGERSASDEVRRAAAEACLAELPPDAVWLWTDGSAEGGVRRGGGGAWIVLPSGEEKEVTVAAGLACSSTRAELTALRAALRATAELPITEQQITICTDSQAALRLLESGPAAQTTTLGAEVWSSLLALREAGHSVHLQWVPSHCGLVGNERADALAGEASTLPQEGVPVDTRTLVGAVRRAATRQWQASWPAGLFRIIMGDSLPKPVPGDDRDAAINVHQLRAGHWGRAESYLHRIGRRPTPACAGCSARTCPAARCIVCREEADSPGHILLRCPSLAGTRLRLLGTIYPPPEAMRDADVVAALAAAFTRHMEPLRGYGAT